MNKLLVTLAGLTLSVGATAGQFNTSTTGSSSQITYASNCTLLSEDVKVNTSKNVAGGYMCNTDTNRIAVAMCHPNGKKVGTGNAFNNIFQGSSAGGSISAVTDALCSGANAETKATTMAALTS